MRRATAFAFLILSAGLIGAEDKPAEKFTISDEEKTILDQTNKEREKEKLPPLKPDPLLFKAAREHTKNMAKQDKLEHTLDGVQAHERVKNAGFKFSTTGENIAAGQAFTPKDAVKAWMESTAGHRENIMSKDYDRIGIGAVRAANGKYYYTQVFAQGRE